MSKKIKNPIVIASIISGSVVIASVIIWIGVCVWDAWVGLVLLYTLLPAAGGFACIAIIIGAVLTSIKSKREAEMYPQPIVQYTTEQQQKQMFCPNCGTPNTVNAKQCVNCAFEL